MVIPGSGCSDLLPFLASRSESVKNDDLIAFAILM